MVTDE